MSEKSISLVKSELFFKITENINNFEFYKKLTINNSTKWDFFLAKQKMYLCFKFPNNSKENILLQIFENIVTKRLIMKINERVVTLKM